MDGCGTLFLPLIQAVWCPKVHHRLRPPPGALGTIRARPSSCCMHDMMASPFAGEVAVAIWGLCSGASQHRAPGQIGICLMYDGPKDGWMYPFGT